MTDVELMGKCMGDAGDILETQFLYSKLSAGEKFSCEVKIAIELFNFRTDKVKTIIATSVPEDDIPF